LVNHSHLPRGMTSFVGRIYDVSLPIVSEGLVFPGDPQIHISGHQSIARGDPANVSALAFGSHTGTHVDAPRHFLQAGGPVDAIPLGCLVGPALVLDFAEDVSEIGAAELRSHDLRGATRVLFRTRNSALLRNRRFTPEYVYLAPDGAKYLLERGVELVGIDYLSIERFDSKDYPVHRMLLERQVAIVEGLDLSEVPEGRYQFICLPLRLKELDGAPARAMLIGEPTGKPSKVEIAS
jgi:arylformamidase